MVLKVFDDSHLKKGNAFLTLITDDEGDIFFVVYSVVVKDQFVFMDTDGNQYGLEELKNKCRLWLISKE